MAVSWPIKGVSHCAKGTASYPLCLSGMGRRWPGCRIECYRDNMAVVAVINSGWSRDKMLMYVLRCMFFVAAHLDIQIHVSHVPGVENVAADTLS